MRLVYLSWSAARKRHGGGRAARRARENDQRHASRGDPLFREAFQAVFAQAARRVQRDDLLVRPVDADHHFVVRQRATAGDGFRET
ncbi:MAG: hypothetical protein ABUS79_28290, partial [Pseudomonadota bacterium]